MLSSVSMWQGFTQVERGRGLNGSAVNQRHDTFGVSDAHAESSLLLVEGVEVGGVILVGAWVVLQCPVVFLARASLCGGGGGGGDSCCAINNSEIYNH